MGAPVLAPPAALRLGGRNDRAEQRAEARAAGLRTATPVAAPGAPTSPGAGAPGLPFAGGHALPASTRAYFEPRLGRPLGDVRVHRSPAATRAAQAIGARGFAVGGEVVIAEPDHDNAVLAHELAHVAEGETGVIRRKDLSRWATVGSLSTADVAAQTDQEAQALYSFMLPLSQADYLDDPGFAENFALVRADLERRHHIGAAPPAPAAPKPVPTPAISGQDSATMLTSLMQSVTGMEQIGSDAFEILWEGRKRTITAAGAAEIRRRTAGELGGGLSSVLRKASSARGMYDTMSEADKKSWLAAPIIKFIGQIKDPGPVMRDLATSAEGDAGRAMAALATGDFVTAARLLASAETSARQADLIVHTYWQDIIATGEITQTVLEYTRDISLGVAVAIGAILAAPLVAGFVAGAGVTGGLGTGLSIVGTGAVVGTGSGVVRATAGAAGSALSGGSRAEIFDAFKNDGKQGAIDGFLAGAGGSAARVLGPALGVGGQAGGQFARRAAAQMIVNSGTTMIDALAHGASIEEAAKRGAIAAVASLPGAALGGVKSRVAQQIAGPLLAAGTAYATAVAQGVPPDEARRAATVAMTTALIVGGAALGRQNDQALEDRGRAAGRSVRNTVVQVGTAVTIGTSNGLEGAAYVRAGSKPVAAIVGGSAPPAQTALASPRTSSEPSAASTTVKAAGAIQDRPESAHPAPAAATQKLVTVPILPSQPSQTAPAAAAPAAAAPVAEAPTQPAAPQTIVGSAQPTADQTLVGSSRYQMRTAAERIVRSDAKHILRFLLDPSGSFHRQQGLTQHHNLADHPELIQMGHMTSDKLGGPERLMLQGAYENQYQNVTIESPHKGGAVLEVQAVSLGGIAVDLGTARFWESIGWLPAGTVAAAPRIAQ